MITPWGIWRRFAKWQQLREMLALSVLMMLATLLSLPGSQPKWQAKRQGNPKIQESYGKLPLRFEQNQGQTDSNVKFLARGKGYTLFLTPTEAVFSLQKQAGPAKVVRLKLLDSNPAATVEGVEELPGKSNYFTGNDPSKWRTNVPSYAKAKLRNVYPGVDLVYYGNGRQMEYDFVVAPGADPRAIRFQVEGAARNVVGPGGDLTLDAAALT